MKDEVCGARRHFFRAFRSAAVQAKGLRKSHYFSGKSRFLKNSSYFCDAESSNGAAKPRCVGMKRESGATPEQFPLL